METEALEINIEGLLDKIRRCGFIPNLVSAVLKRGGHMGAAILDTFDPTAPTSARGYEGSLIPLDNLNPSRNFRAYNFKANVVTGEWQSFATGKSGANVVELWAYVLRCPLDEAARRICQKINISLPLVGEPVD
jgi:hypothetical protein